MAHHKIEIDHECDRCKGMGLYSGFAEKNGAAVVCYGCEGTGKAHMTIEYNDFIARKPSKGIKRVYQHNPGIGIGIGISIGEDNRGGKSFGLEDFGGITYKDWKTGKKFGPGTEMRKFTCPSWWYQTADYNKRPDWKECLIGGSFSGCKEFCNKEKCWERFDKEKK